MLRRLTGVDLTLGAAALAGALLVGIGALPLAPLVVLWLVAVVVIEQESALSATIGVGLLLLIPLPLFGGATETAIRLATVAYALVAAGVLSYGVERLLAARGLSRRRLLLPTTGDRRRLALGGALLLAMVVALWGVGRAPPQPTLDLIEQLPSARLGERSGVAVRRGAEQELALVLSPPPTGRGSISFPLTLPRAALLEVGLAPGDAGSAVERSVWFRVAVRADGVEEEIDARLLLTAPAAPPERAVLDLARWSGREVELILSVEGGDGWWWQPTVHSR